MAYLSLSRSTNIYAFHTMFIFLCLLLRLGHCAVIQRNETRVLQNDAGCTKSADWVGHALPNEEDCAATLSMLYRIELLKHGMNRFEFLGRGAHPEYKLPTMQTPRRYTVGMHLPLFLCSGGLLLKTDSEQGKCTLVIAMLDVFPDGRLPNAPKGPTYGTDIASFRDIELLASNINLHCVVFRHSAGYRVAGRSIRVLL